MSKLTSVRRKELLAHIQREGHCTISGLADRFGVSVATIHRDVNELVERNRCRKVHGGVETIPDSVGESAWNSSFAVRIDRNRDKKRAIARRAAAFVDDEDVVFLDSSTTAFYLARELCMRGPGRLTLVTNSGCIASEFHRFSEQVTLISIGGVYNAMLNSFLGGMAREAVRSLRIGKVFLSAVGITLEGLFTFHEQHAAFLGELIEGSAESFALIDSTKFGRDAVFRICGLKDVGAVVTDSGLDAPARLAYGEAGCRFLASS